MVIHGIAPGPICIPYRQALVRELYLWQDGTLFQEFVFPKFVKLQAERHR
jgi:hypothetical protein